MAQTVKNPPAKWETWIQSLGWEDPLEEDMATHSSILAWRIPWTEEPGGLQPMGSQEPNMTERLSSAQHSRFMFNLVRNFQTNFQVGCNILKSCQKGIRILVVLNSYQHLVSSVLFMSDFLVRVQ